MSDTSIATIVSMVLGILSFIASTILAAIQLFKRPLRAKSEEAEASASAAQKLSDAASNIVSHYEKQIADYEKQVAALEDRLAKVELRLQDSFEAFQLSQNRIIQLEKEKDRLNKEVMRLKLLVGENGNGHTPAESADN